MLSLGIVVPNSQTNTVPSSLREPGSKYITVDVQTYYNAKLLSATGADGAVITYIVLW